MARKVSVSQMINWTTDLPAVLVILIGLAIALFLGDAAVRLIGVCISILGGVAIVVLLAQRLKEFSSLPNEESLAHTEAPTIIPPASADHAQQPMHTPATQNQSDSQHPDLAPMPIPQPSTKSAAFVFDDTDDDQDFSELERSLTLAPEKFTPDVQPPTLGGKFGLETSTQSSTTHPSTNTPAGADVHNQSDHNSERKAALTFDDTSESVIAHIEFTPEIPMEEASVKPIVATAVPPQGYTYMPTPEELNEPIATPDLAVGTSFVQGEEEIRIVGKQPPQTALPSTPQPAAYATDATLEQQTITSAADTHISERVRAAGATTSAPQVLTPPEQVLMNAAHATSTGGSTSSTPPTMTGESPALRFPYRHKPLTIARSEIVSDAPDFVRREPRKEFDYLLQRILILIRSVISARTAAFMWVHTEKQQCIMETCLSDVPNVMQKNHVLPFGKDILTYIVTNGAPEIVIDITPEAEAALLPYYTAPAGIRSFVGVPVISDGVIVGVLFADSPEDNIYNEATVRFLGQFTILISGLIQGYNEKYDLLQASRTLEAIETFRALTAKYDNAPEDICTALIEAVAKLIPATTAGTVIYNEQKHYWYVSDVWIREGASELGREVSREDLRAMHGSEVRLDTSLIGKVITSGKPCHIANASLESFTHTTRITHTEPKHSSSGGSFIAVPFVSTSRCYGALYVEAYGQRRSVSAGGSAFTKQDLELLQIAAEYAGTAIEQIQLKHFLHQHSLVDDATDILNKSGFVQRAKEEFTRASDVQLAFSLLLIGADNYASFSRQGAQFNESVIMHIAQIARKNLRIYDIIGRYGDSVVAVGMIEKNTQQCQIWAEKLRREIAGSMFTVGGKEYAVTVSIGIAEYLKQTSLAELMENVETAFAIARQKSNAVSIFS
jgi:diguanylate cyclase (GGDEF)-like protein